MHAMIQFPDLSPEIFSVTIGSFEFALRWYALAYIAGFLGGWLLARRMAGSDGIWGSVPRPSKEQIDDFIVWIALGYVAIFASAATFVLLQFATLRLPSAKVMAYTYLTPSWVIIWQIALGHPAPGGLVLVGIALTVLALWLLLEGAAKPKPKPKPAEIQS